MLILPALDIYEGKCVRLTKGDFNLRTVYSDSPREVAKWFVDSGFSFVHVVDLEGAKSGKVMNWKTIESVLSLQGIRVEIGGGVRSKNEIDQLIQMGATRVILGSIAVTLPTLVNKWIREVGSKKICIAVDVRDGKIAHSGWLEDFEQSPPALIFEMKNCGASSFICTDVTRDGLLKGPNIELYKELKSFFPDDEVIASGGISSVKDVHALAQAKVSGVIVGKAIYERTIKLSELRPYADEAGYSLP